MQLNGIANVAHNLQPCHMFDSKCIHCHQAAEEEKANKMEKKKQKGDGKTETKGKGRGKGMRRPAAAASGGNASRGKRPLDVTPMAIPDPGKSPKKRQKKSKDVATVDTAEPEVEKPTKTKKDKKAPADGNGKEDEKEKRRAKAKEGWLKLQEVEVPGLVMPKELNGRISFTMKSPDGQGSSVGVILNADSFYISKAVSPNQWPTNCTHLKVGSFSSRGIAFQVSLSNSLN